jgi:hypothetical protein
MAPRSLILATVTMALCSVAAGRSCKVKFAVVYTDGKNVVVGLTPEQQKLWEGEGAKHYKGFCLDTEEPQIVILWSENLSGVEQTKGRIDAFNQRRALGESTDTIRGMASVSSNGLETTQSTGAGVGVVPLDQPVSNAAANIGAEATPPSWTDSSVTLRRSVMIQGKAYYWVLDTRKQPVTVLRQGQAWKDIPRLVYQLPGHQVGADDLASTLADPVGALQNALSWIAKEKKAKRL